MHKRIIYRKLTRNENLAELIGTILGDGNLYKHPRTEHLRVICNSQDIRQIKHIAYLINKIFHKKPSIIKRKNENTTVVSLYQNQISERLSFPAGNKIKNNVGVPPWIYSCKKYIIKCLKGLFDTDGCFQEDSSNYAQYIELKNNCRKLRDDVYNMLLGLGLHPQSGRNYIRLARKSEAHRFKELIDFRNYN